MAQDDSRRYYVILVFLGILLGLYTIRLFNLQVLSSSYKDKAVKNAIREVTIHPARGFIYDRNDSLLVYNDAAYDLMIIPKDIRAFDTAELCRVLDMEPQEVRAKLEKAAAYSKSVASLFKQQISKEDYGYLQEKMSEFPGFFVQNRTLRSYPQPIAAHILGYVSEVDERDVENDSYYAMGDYIGKSGIEKAYEPVLRGVKGKEKKLVDVHNRVVGDFAEGTENIQAIPGTSIWSTLDMQLQRLGEELMAGKRGSIVAIEPKTGEILCLVSSPNYDPNLLVGTARPKNYGKLIADPQKPLFNRALQAAYPPGSTFKLANGLIALQEQIITNSSIYSCSGGGYRIGSHVVHCHNCGGLNIYSAIQRSCNTFFCRAYYNILSNRVKYKNIDEAYTAWLEYMESMGFLKVFNTDLPYELQGRIPSAEYFDKKYNNSWNGNTVVSMGIGQGEAAVTPLQMANMLAVIANEGYYIRPHIVRAIGKRDSLNTQFNEKIYSKIEPRHFRTVLQGMKQVVTGGTGRGAQIPGIEVAGKTGTAQNPHGRDHSVFALIAPANDPQIVVFCLVENGGFGATVACPIASLMAEFYINRKIERTDLEKRMKELNIK
ncbi:MAG: penicillin-binding protein 2 [Bacteroidales bacterium]|nr:penicillin-binding protein 2 [Bacteroidales bacterium]MDY6347375.1 penicillin-binding protein 2 [Bacteroidales bacterium]